MTTRRGFTLLELLIVVLIMGIVAMMVLPATQSVLRHARLRAAATEIVGALEYASNCAIRYQRPFGVVIMSASNEFRVYDVRFVADAQAHPDADPPANAWGVILNPVDKKWYATNFDTAKQCEGVRIDDTASAARIVFYPDGHSSEMANVVVLLCGELRCTITVEVATGRVTVN